MNPQNYIIYNVTIAKPSKQGLTDKQLWVISYELKKNPQYIRQVAAKKR